MNKARLAAAFCIFATAAYAQDKPQGYTCCNLHYDKDWISDVNWRGAPMIPAGAKIKVIDYGWNVANVEIDGKPYRIGLDYGRKEQTVEQFVGKLVVHADPRPRIEKAPQKIRESIKAGRLVEGMTREQAILAVGYPATHRTPSVEAPVWHLWTSRAGRYEVHWGSDGKIERLVGSYY